MIAPSVPPSVARRKNRTAVKRAWFDRQGLIKIGEIIRTARESANLSLDDVAEMTGYAKATISYLENGANKINPPLLEALRRILKPINPDTGNVYGGWELLSMSFVIRLEEIDEV
jgi:transcriptional regulator with XRE-family HTH domain